MFCMPLVPSDLPSTELFSIISDAVVQSPQDQEAAAAFNHVFKDTRNKVRSWQKRKHT